MEKQAKDGTFYKNVGVDNWEVVTRKAKDGTVFKKMGADAWQPMQVSNEPQESRMGEAAINAFTNAATLGYAPDLYAGTKQAIETVGSNIPFFGDGAVDESVYDKSREEYMRRSESLEAQHPNISTAGTFGGYIAPGMGVARGVKAAKGLMSLKAATTGLGKLGAASATLAGEGALIGGAQRPSTQDDMINIPERLQSAAFEGVIGAAIPPVFKGLGATGKAISKVPKKLLAVLGGVNDETITTFLKDPDRYLQASSREQVQDTVTNLVNDINLKVKDGKIGVKEAKDNLKAMGLEIKSGLTDNHKEATEILKQADINLKAAYGNVESGLKEAKPPTHLLPEIDESIRGLKDEVIAGSKESFKILDKIKKKRAPKSTKITKPKLEVVGDFGSEVEISKRIQDNRKAALNLLSPEKLKKTEINVKPLRYALRRMIKKETRSISKDGKAAVGRMSEILEAINGKAKNDKLSAVEAKRLMQDIDADVKTWDSKKMAGSFDDKFNISLKSVRNAIDKQVKKEFPQYRKKMLDVAKDAELLGEASKKFGKPEISLSRLSSIDKPKGIFDRETLKKLGKRTGKDFETHIKEYIDIKDTLKSKSAMNKLKEALPEFDDYQYASTAQKKTLANKLPKYFREALGKTNENKMLKKAVKDYSQALEQQEIIKGWTEKTVQSKIRSVMFNKSNARKQLLGLSKMSDQDLVKMVDDLKVNEAFDKEFRIGSRNVNLMTGLTVGMIGAGPVGLLTGVIMGGIIDMYGPRMTKSILKAVAKIQGIPTVKKLTSLKIPKKIAQQLVDDFYGTTLVAIGDEKKRQNRLDARGVNKWAYRGYEKLKYSDIEENEKTIFDDFKDEMLENPKLKKLLIEASEFSPGTVGFSNVMKKVKQLIKEGK